ncbi:MAG: M48 family metalloprotease, partial [Aliifodinibius sp.]|nr:M48 family metalloprotease [Fodinibius sp.]
MLSLAFLSFTSLFFLCIFFLCQVTAVSYLSDSNKGQLYHDLNPNYILSSGEDASQKAIVQETVQQLIDKEVTELSRHYSIPQGSVKKIGKSITKKIIVIVLLITLFYLLLCMCALTVILRAPWDWQEVSAKTRPIPFLVPPTTLQKQKHGNWQRFLLAVFLTDLGVLNLISLLVCVDIIHFLFTGSCFFKPLGIALQWVSLPFSEFIKATIDVPSIMHPYVKTIIPLLFVVPTLTICFSKMNTFVRKLSRAVLGKIKLLWSGAVIPQHVPAITKDLSLRAGVSIPQIRLLVDRKIRLFTQKRLWDSRAKIYITTGAIEKLSQEELEATIAHEISHIRQGLFHIEFARLISWLLFFPNGSWHSLIDFVEREFDADRQAIQLTEKRKPLISALLKTSLSIDKQKPRKALIRSDNRILSKYRSFRATWRSFDKFLSGDVMVGYTY